MQYRNLGRSGLKVSQLSYGAWVSFGNQLDVKEAKSLLQCCRDNGVNFFDNAEVYANGRAEEIMGQAIRELGWKRSDIVVSTKIFWGGSGPNDKGLSRKHIVEGTKASLKRLDMDYVDVIYCHRPDSSTPIEETVRAMNYAIDKGWAFYWGTSEWSAQQITEAWGIAERLDLLGPVVEQPEYNLLSRHKVESEYLPLYTNYGLGLTTWSPLASGVLTGKYSKGAIPPDSRFALENYKPIADELGVPLSQLAIAWCAANPNVSSVITGATKESQIQENMKAIDVIPLLTPAVMEKIEAVVQSRPKRPESYRTMEVNTGNDGMSKVVGTGIVCLETNIGTKLLLKDVRHAPDVRLHLISASKLDDDGYFGIFNNGQLKLTKGSLVVARGKKSSGLYWFQASIFTNLVNAVESNSSQNYGTRVESH
ncbi:hypothetical protein GH714_005807 [Hevea brasiliensis]|uniref:Uncharacterized protein n=1 Tax=Hevea brasiliensis TaxID=3981 RepID=A0A6A6K9X3_HEVBR|nr:hypothetical protein GH714_005807 [Hevea brasiliensis]